MTQRQTPRRHAPVSSAAEILARQAHRYVRHHYSRAEGCTTEQIAAHLGVSEPHLCRCYRGTFGATITRETRRLRIRRACELLAEDPARPLQALAGEAGYARLSYRSFINAFKAETGLSPSDYRRRLEPHRRDGTTNMVRR